MTRQELISSPGYWEEKIHADLFHQINAYMEHHGLSRTDLAARLGVSRSYVTQVLNGYSDHRISKLVDLALHIGQVPLLQFRSLNRVLHEDQVGHCRAQDQPSRSIRTVLPAAFPALDMQDDWVATTPLTKAVHYRAETLTNPFALQ